MNASIQHKPAVPEVEKNALVLRLELSQRDVNRLRLQLSSYRYEPRTPSLFEKMEVLRNGLDQLTNTNAEIIESIKEKRKMVDSYMESVKLQFAEFNNLHKKIEEYIQVAISSSRNVEPIAQ